jgi:8-oxo-dGTP pyrophosphatase MutT (NUDIX family)
MPRIVRCQGAIVRDDHLLLIQHREHASGRAYWVIPGGGQEGAETEPECVLREMREETSLDVAVERLLLQTPVLEPGDYKWRHTYQCSVLGGEASPGFEPEREASDVYGITAVAWFDLRDPQSWDPEMAADPITGPEVQAIRAALGYGVDQAPA